MLKELWKAPKRISSSVLHYLENLRLRIENTAEVTTELDRKAKKDA